MTPETQHYTVAEMRQTLHALDRDTTAREHAVMALYDKGNADAAKAAALAFDALLTDTTAQSVQ